MGERAGPLDHGILRVHLKGLLSPGLANPRPATRRNVGNPNKEMIQ